MREGPGFQAAGLLSNTGKPRETVDKDPGGFQAVGDFVRILQSTTAPTLVILNMLIADNASTFLHKIGQA
jgi:hypothetical protein